MVRYLQQITDAILASINSQRGLTAKRLMLGREVNMPAHLMFSQVGEHNKDAGNYVNKLTAKLQQAHESDRAKLIISTKRMIRNYDLRL